MTTATQTRRTTKGPHSLTIDTALSSNGHTVYDIMQDQDDGSIFCTCPGWKFCKGDRQDKTCKHLKALGV